MCASQATCSNVQRRFGAIAFEEDLATDDLSTPVPAGELAEAGTSADAPTESAEDLALEWLESNGEPLAESPASHDAMAGGGPSRTATTPAHAKAVAKSAHKPAANVEIEREAAENDVVEPRASEARPSKSPKVSRSQAAAERIEDEYAYITDDLRRVFILAAAMFVLLIALNVIFGLVG